MFGLFQESSIHSDIKLNSQVNSMDSLLGRRPNSMEFNLALEYTLLEIPLHIVLELRVNNCYRSGQIIKI